MFQSVVKEKPDIIAQKVLVVCPVIAGTEVEMIAKAIIPLLSALPDDHVLATVQEEADLELLF